MKILSIILGVYAIVNLILIILSGLGEITDKYLWFGLAYAFMHLIYQGARGEGIFYKHKIKRHEKN